MPLQRGSELVHANGVDLCVETFGDPADPRAFLIMGSSASMDWWEDEFCDLLASGSRFVIRYDHRDTGQSTTYPPGAPGYTFTDLAADAVALLDNFGLESAHVIGMSMGGAIAQLIALEHPDRVESLTLISSSPIASDADLPDMSEETVAGFMVPQPDWSDRDAVIDYGTHLARVSASPSRPFNEPAMRELWGEVFDRTTNMASTMTNHSVLAESDPPVQRLADMSIPTLVLHGVDDPVLPYPHGRALASEIPGAKLLPLEQTGHELPRAVWDVVIPALLEHTSWD